MDVTIDIKTFFIVLVLIALIVLIVYGILLVKKLMVTLDHTNKVLEDVETISEIAAARSQDIDGIVDNVSHVAADISAASSSDSFLTTVTTVAKSAASLKGLLSERDPEIKAAKKRERQSKRSAEMKR